MSFLKKKFIDLKNIKLDKSNGFKGLKDYLKNEKNK
jgi:hypothetical protein